METRKDGYLARLGYVRQEVRKDLFYFAIPALLVFMAGLIVSGRSGYAGLTPLLWNALRHPTSVSSMPVEQLLGLGVLVSGLAFAVTAIITMRKNYAGTVLIRGDHELITHGPFAIVRHPVYLGVLVAVQGVPISAGSLPGVLIMVGLVPIFLIRAGLEERLLIEEFGEAYHAYRRGTKKLVPFVY